MSHQAFSILDQNSDGFIDKNDLTQSFDQFGGKWRPRLTSPYTTDVKSYLQQLNPKVFHIFVLSKSTKLNLSLNTLIYTICSVHLPTVHMDQCSMSDYDL